MKFNRLILLLPLLVGSVSAAATLTVINFGLDGTTVMTGTIKQFAQNQNTGETATNNVLNTTTGADSGICLTTSNAIFSAGAGGTFCPAGNAAYTTGSTVIDSGAGS